MTHRESLDAAPEIFEALAQNRSGYLKALPYPNGQGGNELSGQCCRSSARLLHEPLRKLRPERIVGRDATFPPHLLDKRSRAGRLGGDWRRESKEQRSIDSQRCAKVAKAELSAGLGWPPVADRSQPKAHE